MVRIAKKDKKTIGLDLDDTIRDHNPNRLRLSKRSDLVVEDLDFKKILYGELSLTCRPMKNSLKIIRKLIKQGHKIIIVSRNKKDGRIFARQWLKKYLPELSPRKIYFVEKDKDKAIICQKVKVNIFIDDRIEVLKHLDQSITRILFDPKKEFLLKKFIKISDWQELEKII